MNLLKEFFEYHDKEVLENEGGFLCFKVLKDGEEFFITDLFMSESKRGEGLALELCLRAEEIARERKCRVMTCNICPKEHTVAHTNWLMLRYMKFGFSIINALDGAIVLGKYLGGK